MIVRISGEDQYEVPDADTGALNELEQSVKGIVDRGEGSTFDGAYAKLLEFVRTHGTRVPDDDLQSSDVILPPADTSFEEAGREFTGEGLIPD